jgi:hypothetical protein
MSVMGPAWSIKIKGPTILRRRKGRMRFTFTAWLIAASLAWITMSSIRFSLILDFREGTQMIMMIMISTYLNHHDHLRSPFAFIKGITLFPISFIEFINCS